MINVRKEAVIHVHVYDLDAVCISRRRDLNLDSSDNDDSSQLSDTKLLPSLSI